MYHQCMKEVALSIETYLAGAGRDVASMVDNEPLKCTATLHLYFMKFTFLVVHVVELVKTFPLVYQLQM